MKTAIIVMADTNRRHRDKRFPRGINILHYIPGAKKTIGRLVIDTLKKVRLIDNILVVTDTKYVSGKSLGLRNKDAIIDGGGSIGYNLKKAITYAIKNFSSKRILIQPGDIFYETKEDILDAIVSSESRRREKPFDIFMPFSRYDWYANVTGCWHDAYGFRAGSEKEAHNYVKSELFIVYLPDDKAKAYEILERGASLFNVRRVSAIAPFIFRILIYSGLRITLFYPLLKNSLLQFFKRRKFIANPYSMPKAPSNSPSAENLESFLSSVFRCSFGVLFPEKDGQYCSLLIDPDRKDQMEKFVNEYALIKKRCIGSFL